MIEIKSDDFHLNLGPESRNYENIRPFHTSAGMSDLFLAHKKGLNIDVVIKRVHRDLRQNVSQTNEAEVLKTLKHQYLPRIYDVIQGPQGDIYTVMEYVQGQNLQQYVQTNGPISQKLAHKWGCQLCEAVQYLHQEKNGKHVIYHLDIKPSNLMINESGDICLIDFGTSLICRGQQKARQFLTHGYAAPEQYGVFSQMQQAPWAGGTENWDAAFPGGQAIAGQPTDLEATLPVGQKPARQPTDLEETLPVGRSGLFQSLGNGSAPEKTGSTWAAERRSGISAATDIYAVGATLYYMVTGHKPEKSVDPVTPLENWHPQISRPLCEIIHRAMEKEPTRRFSDAREMLRALNDVVFREKQYRAFVIQRRFVAAALTAAYLFSGASLVYGLRQLGAERENSYLNLISQAQQARASGDYEESQSLLEKAISTQPKRSDAYLELAVSLYQSGSYQGVLDLLDNALQSGSLSGLEGEALGNVYYIQGNCYYELGDYDRSIEVLQQAVAQSQANPSYYRSLAVALARSGQTAEAEEMLSTLEQMRASRADTDMVRAEISAISGQYQEALDYYCQVFGETEDAYQLSHAYLAAAQICQNHGDLDNQISILEQAVENLESQYALLQREMLADAYCEKAVEDTARQQAWYQKAEQVLESLVQDGAATMATYMNYALVEQSLEKFEQAESVLLKLQEQYPQNYQPDMRLAYLLIDWQGAKPVGSRDYTQAQDYYLSARKKYQQAQANGQEDQNMVVLQNLISQLEDTGWL